MTCPYCNSSFISTSICIENGTKKYWIECCRCGARGPKLSKRSLAEHVWSMVKLDLVLFLRKYLISSET